MGDPSQSGVQPHVLMLATQRWPTAARLGLALHASGCRISLWSPREHPLLLTNACSDHFPYVVFKPLVSLEAAVLAAAPDLIVPCDDLATLRLQQLAERATPDRQLDTIGALIERSLGPPAQLRELTSRTSVLEIAAEGHLAVPPHSRVQSAEQLRTWLQTYGFPAYLKADGTSGGMGVRLIRNHNEAEAALHALSALPHPLRALKCFAVDRNPTQIDCLLRRARPEISVQQAVVGSDANSAIFCWKGEVLASITVEVVATLYQHGPSTVLRRIQNTAMDHAARVLAARLQLSGFYGLDFILDEQTGTPWLIEMNRRATQTAHLALGHGKDLAAAAFAAILGKAVRPRPCVTTLRTFALFPQEWQRDPTSAFLRSAYHDVPWDAPELVRWYVNQRPGWRRLLSYQFWRARRQRALPLEPADGTVARVP
ncbi:MAG: hypothetical protein JWM54_1336 [Acidobacteriaceae bacterium]|nr:hypothetical protein [Acidobacteriaceae bacterium]